MVLLATEKTALKSLINKYNPDVIMLQETMGMGETVMAYLGKILASWTFVTADARGRSRGLALGLRDSVLKMKNS